VAGYTGIIEQGLEQQQGATGRATDQNANVSMLDGRLDVAAGGAIAIPERIEAWRLGVAGSVAISRDRMPSTRPVRSFIVPTDGDDI